MRCFIFFGQHNTKKKTTQQKDKKVKGHRASMDVHTNIYICQAVTGIAISTTLQVFSKAQFFDHAV